MTTESKLEHKISMARTTNATLVNEIEQMGGNVDVATARVEFLTNWLVENGIITQEQRLTEQLEWEQGFKPQLVRVRDALRESLQEANRAAQERLRKHGPKVNAKPAELPPDGPKLILP